MLESNRKTVQYAYWYQSKCPWIIYVLVWENKAQFYSWKELVKHALEEAEMEEPDVGNSYHTSTQLPLSHCSKCQLECTKRVAALGGCSCVHATDRCCGLSGIWTSWKRVSGITPSRWLWLPRRLKWCSLVNGFPVQEAFLKDDQYNASGEPVPGQDFTSWRVVNQWTTRDLWRGTRDGPSAPRRLKPWAFQSLWWTRLTSQHPRFWRRVGVEEWRIMTGRVYRSRLNRFKKREYGWSI